MSLFGLFDIGKSAIYASQAALSTVSHNIANVNTPGYSSQEVILNIANPVPFGNGSIGTGVAVSGIKRNYESFIQSQLVGQYQNQGRSDALKQALSQVEQVFNDVQDMGISSSLNDYFNAWNDVAVNPEGQPQRMTLLQKANTLVTVAKQMEGGLTANLNQINDGIVSTVDRINTIAGSIASLNEKIVRQEAGGGLGTANDLRDQRDSLMNELSGLADISSFEDNNGSVTVTMGMRNLVSGERAYTLSAQTNQNGGKDLYLGNTNITAGVGKGQLGGLIASRAEIESGPLLGLRTLVASVIKEVNTLHRQGFGLDDTTGNDFFTLKLSAGTSSATASISSPIVADPSALTFDDYTVTFDASSNYYVNDVQTGAVVTTGVYNPLGTTVTFDGIRITMTGAAASTDSFSIGSPLPDVIKNFGVEVTDVRKIAASSLAASPGDNTNALALADLAVDSINDLGGDTFMNYYKGLVSTVGVMSRAASDSLTFDNSLLADIESRRDSVSGVSLDEEATNLMKFQRSFEAGAKMVQVADELVQTVMNMVSM